MSELHEAFARVEALTNLEKKTTPEEREYRLDRMERLLDLLDHPQKDLKIIHIAGSKGKGSTAIYLAKLLEHQGMKVGLYTSPHVLSYTERMSLAGRPFPEESYLKAFRDLERRLGNPWLVPGLPSEISPEPTTFEILTLWAFLLFHQEKTDWVVLETGLGGRLDATNVCQPMATLITPIELEHTEILGSDIPSIAREKAGIIKEGVPLWWTHKHPEASEVISERAKNVGAPTPQRNFEVLSWGARGGELSTPWGKWEVESAMLGRFQGSNVALALDAFCYFFPMASQESMKTALAQAILPGRMEMVRSQPPLILDGGHTPSSMENLVQTMGEFPIEGWTLVFGAVKGKRIQEMAEILAPYFDLILLSRPGTFRPSDQREMMEAFQQAGGDPKWFEDSCEALNFLKGEPSWEKRGLVIAGSFFLLGEVRNCL